MSGEFVIQIEDAGFLQALAQLHDLGADLTQPFRAAGQAIENRIREGFRQHADPWGTAWPPLAPGTIKARQRRGNDSTAPLQDTMELYGSLKSVPDTNSVTVSMGVDSDPRATANQFGTDRIPARPFFPLRDESTAELPQPWWDEALAPVRAAIEQAATP